MTNTTLSQYVSDTFHVQASPKSFISGLEKQYTDALAHDNLDQSDGEATGFLDLSNADLDAYLKTAKDEDGTDLTTEEKTAFKEHIQDIQYMEIEKRVTADYTKSLTDVDEATIQTTLEGLGLPQEDQERIKTQLQFTKMKCELRTFDGNGKLKDITDADIDAYLSTQTLLDDTAKEAFKTEIQQMRDNQNK